MPNRRDLIKLSAASAGVLIGAGACRDNTAANRGDVAVQTPLDVPIVISTWNHGLAANLAAWDILEAGGYALDAVEQGVRTAEADPDNQSVGLGGLPDRTGRVTLDACIMNELSDCGSVAALQDIKHPISVARRVMDATPHVMLVGQGAKDFALSQGFSEEMLLLEPARAQWQAWLKEQAYTPPPINTENHDTIGMLALDEQGRICGACTTSGAAYKLHGRVGDSPIIGAGLFIDQDVGGACATGLGEAVIRVAGSAALVELMRGGMSPEAACHAMIERVISKNRDTENLQVGFLAMNIQGETGAYSVYNGFNYAVKTKKIDRLIDAPYKREW